MKNLGVVLRLTCVFLAFQATSLGTSYVMMQDVDLVDQAELVIIGTIANRQTGHLVRPVTQYLVEIEQVLKGSIPSGPLQVEVAGGTSSDGSRLFVFGVPEFQGGERTILFLTGNGRGSYGILHLLLGAFQELTVGQQKIAYRELSQAQELNGNTALAQRFQQPRAFDLFARWLSDHARGDTREIDYFVELESPVHQQNFAFSGLGPSRIFEFDGNMSVEWLTQAGGQPGLAGGGTAEFQQALDSWNSVPNVSVHYTLAGTTASTAGLTTADGINAIIYGDPNSEVPGTYDCSTGGVLGTGANRAQGIDVYNNQTSFKITEVDITMNDGVECTFQTAGGSKRAEEVYAHELGHTLGLGHSCGQFMACSNPVFDGALMRAMAHFDGRGAQLNSDDIAGIRALYGVVNPFANLFFAQYVNGPALGFANKTRIVLTNNGGQTDTGVIRFFDADGAPQPVPVSQPGVAPLALTSTVNYRVEPGGVFDVETDGTGELVSGPIEVESDLGTNSVLEGTEIFSLLGKFVSVLSSVPGEGRRVFVSVNGEETAGVALFNPDRSKAVNVSLSLDDADGSTRSNKDLLVQPGEQISVYVTDAVLFKDYFDTNPGDFIGSLGLFSEDLLVVLGLIQKRSDGTLLAVPTSRNVQP